ncbi:hypothetical protein H9P43_006777 [Blastocladiella emersonii ATCC 22665]|nr:hypothetical protein H9P43_006777 [Blastocladiella emersonii ATCC 22665]
MQLRVSILVYGPFVDAEILEAHCYADYLETCNDGIPAVAFDEYRKRFAETVTAARTSFMKTAAAILKDKRLARIHPKLPAVKSVGVARTLDFNQHWMVQIQPDSIGLHHLHPFLVQVIERCTNWRDGNWVDAIDEYIARLNARVARTNGTGAKVFTLQQLAPCIMVALATLASGGVASHQGVASYRRPPLEPFYNEAITALHDQDGVLREQFAEDSYTLLDKMRVASARNNLGQAPRNAMTGLPLATFIQRREEK